jgi:hypothetical protein
LYNRICIIVALVKDLPTAQRSLCKFRHLTNYHIWVSAEMLHIVHRSFCAVQKNCCFSSPQDNVCKKDYVLITIQACLQESSPLNTAGKNPHQGGEPVTNQSLFRATRASSGFCESGRLQT